MGSKFSYALPFVHRKPQQNSGAVAMGKAAPQVADGGVGMSKNRGAAVLTADKTVSLFSGWKPVSMTKKRRKRSKKEKKRGKSSSSDSSDSSSSSSGEKKKKKGLKKEKQASKSAALSNSDLEKN